MLLPGTNYSMELMQSLESYRETWVDGRLSRFYAETIASLQKAGELSEADKKQIRQIKQETGDDGVLGLAIDVFDAARKGARFSKAAAPLILADGPLPFGDTIFVIALGLDFAIAAYDVAQKVFDDD